MRARMGLESRPSELQRADGLTDRQSHLQPAQLCTLPPKAALSMAPEELERYVRRCFRVDALNAAYALHSVPVFQLAWLLAALPRAHWTLVQYETLYGGASSEGALRRLASRLGLPDEAIRRQPECRLGSGRGSHRNSFVVDARADARADAKVDARVGASGDASAVTVGSRRHGRCRHTITPTSQPSSPHGMRLSSLSSGRATPRSLGGGTRGTAKPLVGRPRWSIRMRVPLGECKV